MLGVPIGNQKYVQDFIKEKVKAAAEGAEAICEGLNNHQTKLQLFKTCTVHKVTHLYSADVLSSIPSNLPQNWHLWRSSMVDDFNTMCNNFLCSLTEREDMPAHSQLISHMSTSSGGLGIQHPRCTAIPMFVLTTKRCLDYCFNGVWLDRTAPTVELPTNITDLFTDWRTSERPTFQIFRKYSEEIAHVCVAESVEDRFAHFIHKSSPNTCKDRIKSEASRRVLNFLEHNMKEGLSKQKLKELTQVSTSKSLLDMSRSQASSRQKNDNFIINLKRKLRLELWPNGDQVICKCGQVMDPFGDHAFNCTCCSKKAMHDEIRDGLITLLQRLLKTVKMIQNSSQVEKEPEELLKLVPSIRPFDLAIKLNHSVGERQWHSPLSRIGFDVNCIPSGASTSAKSQAARKKSSIERLQDGEIGKFCRNHHTDKDTGVTLSGDEIIGEILRHDMALVPITVTEFGMFGSLFNRFLFGTDALPNPPFDEKVSQADAASKLARSKKVPRGVLVRANDIWRHEHPDEFYGHSYKAMDPKSYAVQQLGLITTTAISNHILRAYGKVKTTQAASEEERNKFGSLLFDGACYYKTDVVHMRGSTGVDGSFERHSLCSSVVVPTV